MKQQKKINILATGCGGDLGASVARICKSSEIFNRVIGCNNHDDHFSKYLYDDYHVVENFDSSNYKKQIHDIVISEDIDIIVPLSEIELRLIHGRRLGDEYGGIPYLSANLESLEIGLDKLLTAKMLEQAELPFPQTHIFSEMEGRLSYPFIIKSRRGYGSNTVYLVEDSAQHQIYVSDYPDFIAQEYLNVDDAEYTCGLFASKDSKTTRSIVMHRNLYEGTTSYGSVESFPDVDYILRQIAMELNLSGAINVQLRITQKGPVVFEINPRFSSTVRFRHLMGFEDFIWSVQDALKLPISEYHPPLPGTKFYRDSNEIIVGI